MQTKGLSTVLAAVLGALAGAAATHFYWRSRHLDELEETRNDLREYYTRKIAEATETATQELHEALENEKAERAKEIRRGIADFTDRMLLPGEVTSEQFREQIQNLKIYIIRPDEFGQLEGYGKWKYTYFPDDGKYVSSDDGMIAEAKELKETFGALKPPEHFGEFEDDVVYIRNEELEMDVAVYLADGSLDTEEESEED